MSNWSVVVRCGNSYSCAQAALLGNQNDKPGNEVYARLRSNLSQEQAESVASFINTHFLRRNYATAERD